MHDIIICGWLMFESNVWVNSCCISSELINMIVIKSRYHSGVTLNFLWKKMLLITHKTKFNGESEMVIFFLYLIMSTCNIILPLRKSGNVKKLLKNDKMWWRFYSDWQPVAECEWFISTGSECWNNLLSSQFQNIQPLHKWHRTTFWSTSLWDQQQHNKLHMTA